MVKEMSNTLPYYCLSSTIEHSLGILVNWDLKYLVQWRLNFFASCPLALCIDPMTFILEHFTKRYKFYLMYVYTILLHFLVYRIIVHGWMITFFLLPFNSSLLWILLYFNCNTGWLETLNTLKKKKKKKKKKNLYLPPPPPHPGKLLEPP